MSKRILLAVAPSKEELVQIDHVVGGLLSLGGFFEDTKATIVFPKKPIFDCCVILPKKSSKVDLPKGITFDELHFMGVEDASLVKTVAKEFSVKSASIKPVKMADEISYFEAFV